MGHKNWAQVLKVEIHPSLFYPLCNELLEFFVNLFWRKIFPRSLLTNFFLAVLASVRCLGA
jgi:hypothetical protein